MIMRHLSCLTQSYRLYPLIFMTLILNLFVPLSIPFHVIYANEAAKNKIDAKKIHELNVAFKASKVKELREVLFYPFVSTTQILIRENLFNPNLVNLLTMKPHWQVISVDKDILINECHALGKLETIDWAKIPHKNSLHPSALESCGVGYAVSSTVLAYSMAHKYGTPPFSWDAIFNTARYPGIRALPKHARGNLEIALLADGIKTENLYSTLATKQGQQRAFDKLSQVKDALMWWENLHDTKHLLLNADIAMIIGTDVDLLENTNANQIGIVRNQVIYKMSYFAIPKTAVQQDLAYRFLDFATQTEPQMALAKQIKYGLANQDASRILPSEIKTKVSNYPLNLKNGILENSAFYAEHGADLEQKFQKWLSELHPNVTPLIVKPNTSAEPDSTLPQYQEPIP